MSNRELVESFPGGTSTGIPIKDAHALDPRDDDFARELADRFGARLLAVTGDQDRPVTRHQNGRPS